MSAENVLDQLETVAMCPDHDEYAMDLWKMMGRYILYEQLIMWGSVLSKTHPLLRSHHHP